MYQFKHDHITLPWFIAFILLCFLFFPSVIHSALQTSSEFTEVDELAFDLADNEDTSDGPLIGIFCQIDNYFPSSKGFYKRSFFKFFEDGKLYYWENALFDLSNNTLVDLEPTQIGSFLLEDGFIYLQFENGENDEAKAFSFLNDKIRELRFRNDFFIHGKCIP
jgi:hypothetical protein